MKSLTLLRVVFIDTLAIAGLDDRFLHNRFSDAGPDCGRCWARRQLRSSIQDVPVALELMKLLTIMGVNLIGPLALPEPDVRFLHSHCSDPASDCGRLLGSMPATQRYKGRLCRIKAHEITDPSGGCLYRYAGDPRARWRFPPRPRGRFWIRLRGNVGLNASFTMM